MLHVGGFASAGIVVLAHVQTYADPEFVTARLQSHTSRGFTVALEGLSDANGETDTMCTLEPLVFRVAATCTSAGRSSNTSERINAPLRYMLSLRWCMSTARCSRSPLQKTYGVW